ncbi:MAG TPA: dihydrofolate reductase family protein [Polyangiales bacterium]
MEGQVPEVAAWLGELYGTTELATRGVVHVTSVDPSLHVIAIGPGAPESEGDFFVLNLARARADAVLTSGSILRLEPHYRVALAGPHAAVLATYRREVLHKPKPPLCAVMTRDGELPLDHPFWDDDHDKWVLTSPARASALQRELGARATVIGVDALDARGAVELMAQGGATLISIEAGPSANAALYRAPALVTELLLSIYQGPPVHLGAALASELLQGMTLVSDVVRNERSGPWRYQRWLRT